MVAQASACGFSAAGLVQALRNQDTTRRGGNKHKRIPIHSFDAFIYLRISHLAEEPPTNAIGHATFIPGTKAQSYEKPQIQTPTHPVSP